MRVHLSVAFIALLVAAAWQPAAWGQQRGSSSSGLFGGSRSLGSTLSAGSRSFGSSSSFGGSSSQSRTGSTGRTNPGQRLLGTNQQLGQFIGTTAQQARDVAGVMSAGGNTGRRSQSRSIGPSSYQGSTANQGARSGGRRGRRTTEIRTSMSVGFTYTLPTPAARSSTLATRLERSTGVRTQSPVEVLIDKDGTATLRGVVTTEHGRVLAERLALLEAGIWKVNNELSVAEPKKLPVPANSAP